MTDPIRIEFLARVADRVKKRFPLVKLESDEEGFALRVNGCLTGLENLYRAIADQPEKFEPAVDRWFLDLLRIAEGQPDRNPDLDEARGRVMPVIVSAEKREALGSVAVAQPLLADLYTAYVFG